MTRTSIRLRLLTGEDAEWVIDLDEVSAGQTAHAHDWHPDKLRAGLDEGYWATEDRMAWAVALDGEPVGYALATSLASGSGYLEMRIRPDKRGMGVGREVLRLLADHHFSEDSSLRRLAGQTHEANVPMQRAFVAAGFRMEARYRDSFEQADGTRTSEWGYALTRADWENGRLSPSTEFDLHGRQFVIDTDGDGAPAAPSPDRIVVKVLQEGRRVLARYEGGAVHEGESAGLLLDGDVTFQLVHEVEVPGGDPRQVTGQLRGRVQRLADGRFELLATCVLDGGEPFELQMVEPSA